MLSKWCVSTVYSLLSIFQEPPRRFHLHNQSTHQIISNSQTLINTMEIHQHSQGTPADDYQNRWLKPKVIIGVCMRSVCYQRSHTVLIGTATTFGTIGCSKYKINHSHKGTLAYNQWTPFFFFFFFFLKHDILPKNKWPHQMI